MSHRSCSQVLAEVRRTIEGELRRLRAEAGTPQSLLDIGCWDGSATRAYADILQGPASGIEVFAGPAGQARARGVDVREVDLELQPFPWPDASFDVVTVNQVFEHLKNIWLPMSEIARVLRVGGHVVFSVPNLSSLHNRVMLALGLQPSSIRTFGPHVRGFTYLEARRFLGFGSCFTIRRARGVGFYPFPARLATPLARLWTSASHTPVFVARRDATVDAQPWLTNARANAELGEQTFYAGT